MIQTKLHIFEHCETKAEIVCRRIINRCIEAGNKRQKRIGKLMSIKEVINQSYE